MPITAGLVIAGGSALFKLGKGIVQNAKANKLAKQNVRPDYVIPDEFKQNLSQANQMAQVGLPQQQYNNALNNIGRNQSGGLGALSRSANPAAGIASLVRAGNDATNNLDMQDAAARNSNQKLAMQYRNMLGQQELAKQSWDKFDKYKENAAAIRGLKGAGQQNIDGGITGLGSAGITAISGGLDLSGTAAGATRYAGGNFLQRMNGGLTTPNSDIPNGYSAGFSSAINPKLTQGLSGSPLYNYGAQWFNPTVNTSFAPQ